MAFPLLFSAARWIDPSLDADVYADEPWIFGPALASMSAISTSSPSSPPCPEKKGGGGGEEVGGLVEDNGMGLTAKARRKHFLTERRRKEWVFEPGKVYEMEFSGPWLDLAEFRVVLPGFRVDILKYWDGQPLRFLLRNRASGEVYLVVEFDLVEGEEEGSDGRSTSSGEEDID
ncbi:unnamed protein product [Tuber melanosporum]|uniref:(Perigord truffle) hypothetical protein n=1 Tax=Tuber melanosporum (strain Mel28) TaxID=656061 RepID=D5GNH8_TUBMM|nr:uncharacterized protein GSTUM_00011296001 [Tuber melanosporum]CAZ86071.1 unnamed protein product [Tuber melanosporum]